MRSRAAWSDAGAAVVGELARQSAVLDAEPPARRPDVLADVIALDARSS